MLGDKFNDFEGRRQNSSLLPVFMQLSRTCTTCGLKGMKGTGNNEQRFGKYRVVYVYHYYGKRY